MPKFIVIDEDGWDTNSIYNTMDDALAECQSAAESTPDTEFWVAELKAKIKAELKIDIITDENKLPPAKE